MQDVSKGGRTVLFVSHNMGAVASLCKTGFWMQQGRLVKSGQAREIVDEYLTKNLGTINVVVDLSEAKRQGDAGRRLKIQKVEWLSGLPMQHGEKFSIRVHFSTRDAVEEIAIGIGFCNLEGTRLLTYDSDFQSGRRLNVTGETKGFVDIIAQDFPLAPGLYNFAVGCRSGDAFGLDYIPEAGQIEVVMGPKTPGYINVPGAGVRLFSEWEWNFPPDK